MARDTHIRTSNTTGTQYLRSDPRVRISLFAGLAAFMGMAVGFAAALAVLLPAIHTDLAAQTKQLSDRLVALTPMPSALSSACAQSSPAAPAGHVLGASATAMPVVAASAVSTAPVPASGSTFVTKLIGGTLAHTTATIAHTGPASTNTITTANTTDTTVTNTTNVAAANNTVQSAQSGDVHDAQNTTAGAASSGSAANTNSVLALLTVSN